ncbi:beta-1,6-N-acetylglucosaminyltransferase [Rosenbergiella collisarenosi]|uniref:beta-1,6-N-acetylglucosaminyltransferase n=1 Tax=Rosenbergiella collisarenosi TaxID=1544695 RepID=UPI001F4DD83D|nr:beta-1,6-N-acetylglucosaminyltransferase [Rosenbergiella collisarenosi]
MPGNTAVLIQAHNNLSYILFLAEKFLGINFYVHIDSKNIEDNIKLRECNYSNIQFISNPKSVYWGGYSQVKATLKLLTLAYENPENEFFHLMSGECIPLKDFYEIEKEWHASKEKVYMEILDRPEVYWRLNVKVPYVDSNFMRKIPGKVCNRFFMMLGKLYKNTAIPKENYCYGSQWFSIRREVVTLILEENGIGFFKNFKFISCSDEHAFQILLKSNGFECINNKRFIKFITGKSSPEYLNKDDLMLAKKNNYWFARKVKYEVSKEYLSESV